MHQFKKLPFNPNKTITNSSISKYKSLFPNSQQTQIKNITNIKNIKNINISNNVKFALTIPFTTVTIQSITTLPIAWIHSLFGGTIIGSSASLYLLFNGRIAGISGIVSRCFDHICTMGRVTAAPSQFGFFGGLLFGGWFAQNYLQIQNNNNNRRNINNDNYNIILNKLYNLIKFNEIKPFKDIPFDSRIMLLSGILVGFGSRMGSGCTSGHGICGIARLSKRSIIAVSIFMLTAIITTSLSNIYLNNYYHCNYNEYHSNKFRLNLLNSIMEQYSPAMSKFLVPLISFMLIGAAISGGLRRYQNETFSAILPSLLSGIIIYLSFFKFVCKK